MRELRELLTSLGVAIACLVALAAAPAALRRIRRARARARCVVCGNPLTRFEAEAWGRCAADAPLGSLRTPARRREGRPRA